MSRRPTEFHYYDWDFNRWFGSETRARARAINQEGLPPGLLGAAASGIYRELLDYCAKDGSIPADIGGLSALAGVSPEVIEMVWPVLKPKFLAHKKLQNRLTNSEVDLRRRNWKTKSKKNSEAGRASARKKGIDKPLNDNELGNDRSTTVQRPLNEEIGSRNKEVGNRKEEVASTAHARPPADLLAYRLDEQYLDFKSAAERYGIQCSEQEWNDAHRFVWLLKLRPEERPLAIQGFHDRIAAGDQSLVNCTPRNYLEKRLWHRRIGSAPMSRAAKASGESKVLNALLGGESASNK